VRQHGASAVGYQPNLGGPDITQRVAEERVSPRAPEANSDGPVLIVAARLVAVANLHDYCLSQPPCSQHTPVVPFARIMNYRSWPDDALLQAL
jgi:hypothetical protein